MRLLVICLALFLTGQDNFCAGQQNKLRPEIFQHWLHSHEEDQNGTQVFRPQSYRFPPARGRIGFEIKKNGEFVYYNIARGDGSEEAPGHWKAEGKNRIVVSFDKKEIKPLTIVIVSYNREILRIKFDQ